MTDLKKIINRVKEWKRQNLKVAMATVISIRGSSYRRPGARMVISSDRQRFGMIGGGCFDEDVHEIALKVIDSNIPELHLYNLSGDEIWGLGLGCNGSVYILIESLSTDEGCEWIQKIESSIDNRDPLLVEHHINVPLDFKTEYHGIVEYHRTFDTLSPKNITNRNANYINENNLFSFREIISGSPRLVIFGAGNDVIPVVELAYQAGFEVMIVDTRANLLNHQRFKHASKFVFAREGDFDSKIIPYPGDYVLFMSHKINYDANAFRFYYKHDVNYFGFLGPKDRTNSILFDILQLDKSSIENVKNKIYSPIGLNLGAETPEEVAISIVSELLAVRNGTIPIFLKNKQGPIHSQNGGSQYEKV